MNNTNKKSQVEIMGLLIIVILVVMVIFIVIIFNAAKTPQTIQKSYTNDQLGTSFILSFLDTSTHCSDGKTFREVIADCASTQRLDCLGRSSCDYLNNTINQSLLDETLTKWGINYEFKVEHSRFIHYRNLTYSQGCGSNSMVNKESFQIIPLWPNRNQVVKVSMKICGS